MKRIFFLGDTLLNNEPLGIQRFAYEILRELDAIERDYDIELVIPEDTVCKIEFNNIKIVRYGKYRSPFIWRQVSFPRYVRSQKGIAIDLTLGLVVLNHDIVGIFDCIYEKYPKDFRSVREKIKRESYKLRAKFVIKHSKQIITISNHSKADILDCYKIPEDKITVIGCGWQHFQRVEEDYQIIQKLGLKEEKFVFALGSSLPHKNFEWILRAARNNPEYKFVVTGTNRLSNYQSELKTNDFKNLKFTGFLRDDEVKALMNACILFLHPSLYEGFAIPPLEAIYSGADVAVSNATCLPEIFGKSVCYFDPLEELPNINELKNKQKAITENDRNNVLDMYSWRKSAIQVDQLFSSILRS